MNLQNLFEHKLHIFTLMLRNVQKERQWGKIQDIQAMQLLRCDSYQDPHMHTPICTYKTQQQQKLLNLCAWSPISNKLIFQLTHNFADGYLKLITHDMVFLLCLKHELQSKENHLPNKSFLISPEFWNSDYPKHFY
jgi:hypothetical protein